MLGWINLKLSTSYTEINGALAALAISNGIDSFSQLGTFDASTSAGTAAILMESSGYILTETGFHILLEH